MKIINNKILVPLFVVFCSLANAQNTPGVPCFPGDPCDQKPSSPIDMYVYVLGAVAILMIAYFTKKYKLSKI